MVDTDQIIAEVDFDLAAFAAQELYDYKLKMCDTVAVPENIADQGYESATSLEDLLMMTDDSFEIDRKAVKKIGSRVR